MAVRESFHDQAQMRRYVLLVGSAILFLFTTVMGVFQQFGQDLDNLGMEALIARESAVPTWINALTHLVSAPAIVVVTLGVTLVAVLRRRPALALRAAVLVIGANLLTQAFKALLDRPNLGVGIPLENSYPSGHVTFAAAVSVALIIVAPRGFRTGAALFGWVWVSLMTVVVVAQGWHRPADVIGAILIVAMWAYALTPIEVRTRQLDQLARGGAVLAWLLFVVGAVALAVAAWNVRGYLALPLSLDELQTLTEGTATGTWFAVAAVVLPSGLAAILMSTIDRFAVNRLGLSAQTLVAETSTNH